MGILGTGYRTLVQFMAKLDRTNYEGGREQAYVKHYLLERYLSSWGYIIGGSTWDSLVFVDGFAGPWGAKHEQFADASFGIAVRALNEAIDGLFETRKIVVRGLCVFVETKPKPFARLDKFAKENSTDSVRAIALRGRFIENIKAINAHVAAVGANPFKFVFLDQKGWAATPMAKLRPFLRERSCEVLFNLMTSFLTRFVDARSRESSYHELFGRRGVLEKIRALPKGTGEREEAAVQEYCKSLRDICGFRYVSQAVILDPSKEKVLYHLIFATKNPRGIEVFKRAEIEAAKIQDEVRYEAHLRRTGPDLPGLFESGPPRSRLVLQLWRRYTDLARRKVLEVLITSSAVIGVSYKDLFGVAMEFPLVSPEDLIAWLKALEPHVKVNFELSEKRKNPKKPSPMFDDRIVVTNVHALR
jgi:three-Cys-motif partner protein